MTAIGRAEAFCARFGIEVPILMAPMAGSCPPALAAAVAQAGGLGAGGMLVLNPDQIGAWAKAVRELTDRPFQLNNWVPDPAPARDGPHENALRAFLGGWGPPVPESAGDAVPLDFTAQCEAMLAARPAVMSSVMGLFPDGLVKRIRASGIAWYAHVSTLAEARAAEAAGADVIVAQGAEAGGYRAAFHAEADERRAVGLMALVPAIVDAVKVPVVAAGGIADGRGVAAALALGASAAMMGTALLRSPEAGVHPAWAEGLAAAAPEDTLISRVFSGRAGRSLATDYVLGATAPDAPPPAPYPVQRGLTGPMRAAAMREGDLARLQAWAGQSAALTRPAPAGEMVRAAWAEARSLLV